ncbi:MAG: nucleotidyltransferase family protein [Candidatus Methylomirabilales bacterium]
MGRNRQIERLVRILRERMPELKDRYKVTSMGLFGSYVRQAQRKKSDLDLLVEFQEPPSLLTFLRLEHDLSDLLGVKVDLVMKDALRPTIARRILSELVPV